MNSKEYYTKYKLPPLTNHLSETDINFILGQAGFKREIINGKQYICRRWNGSRSVVVAKVRLDMQGYKLKTVAVDEHPTE